jgi:hypothetical protein
MTRPACVEPVRRAALSRNGARGLGTTYRFDTNGLPAT